MEEIWKDVKDYENLYQVSNLGRVKRILFVNNIIIKQKEVIIKQNINKRNRCIAHLYKNNKRKAISVHRLVANAFIENPNNLPQVNHIDGNPKNNKVSNLEWCSASYNCKHAYINDLTKLKEYNKSKMKPIIRSDDKIYNNAYDASKDLNVSVCSIRDCLKNRIKTCKGFTFKYLEWGSKGDV